jgi:hypothetical protein
MLIFCRFSKILQKSFDKIFSLCYTFVNQSAEQRRYGYSAAPFVFRERGQTKEYLYANASKETGGYFYGH